jgi:hypothetical protein
VIKFEDIPKQVIILSDGTGKGTSVIVNGVRVDHLTRVEWSIDKAGFTHATIGILGARIEFTGNMREVENAPVQDQCTCGNPSREELTSYPPKCRDCGKISSGFVPGVTGP